MGAQRGQGWLRAYRLDRENEGMRERDEGTKGRPPPPVRADHTACGVYLSDLRKQQQQRQAAHAHTTHSADRTATHSDPLLELTI